MNLESSEPINEAGPVVATEVGPEALLQPEPDTTPAQTPVGDEQSPDLQAATEAAPQVAGFEDMAQMTPISAARAKVKRPAKKAAQSGSKMTWAYPLAALAGILWIGSLVAFVMGFQARVGPFDFDPFILGIFALLAFGPLGFIGFAAYALNQGARFGAQARRTQALADHMVVPAALAIGETGMLVSGIRGEIEAAAAASALARSEMSALSTVLAQETQKLVDAAAASAKTAFEISAALGQERQALSAISQTIDDQVVRVNDAVSRQARMVVDAAEVADAQIREAEQALAARSSDLSAAANEASANARHAGEDLGREVLRLKDAGNDFNEQVRAVQNSLGQQTGVLADAAAGLRAEQESLDAALITRRSQLTDIIAQGRETAEAIDSTAREASQQIERLSAISQERAEELNEAVRSHRSALASAAIESIGAITEASGRHKDLLLQQTRDMVEAMNLAAQQAQTSAQTHVKTATAQLDALNEAAFGAGQQAEAMFAARLEDARVLIGQSVRLAEEAGARSSEQLGRNLGATRDAVNQFADLLSDFENRIAQLPAEAARQAESASERLAQGIVQGMAHLATAANKAAEETLSVDARFQDRVRRNYQALGEAVRQLEQVAAARAAIPEIQPQPIVQPAVQPFMGLAQAPVSAAGAAGRPALQRPSPQPSAKGNIRQRPAALDADDEFSSAFEGGVSAGQPARDDQWSWKELLTSMDDTGMDDDQLADWMVQEARGMNLDAQALLPRPRIDEIASVINSGDLKGARNRVKRMAAPAVRLLARRLVTDPAMTVKVRRFVARQTAVLAGAASRDRDGFLTATLLSNEQGRVFLLMDAALSEVG